MILLFLLSSQAFVRKCSNTNLKKVKNLLKNNTVIMSDSLTIHI